MSTLVCPACGCSLQVSMSAPEAPSPLTVEALVAAVEQGPASLRTAAGRVLERPVTAAEVEVARRRLAVAVRDGRLRACGVPGRGGVVTMYRVTSSPATG